MEASGILAFLFHGNQLKRTARSGWAQRGVVNGEDVAAHTFGVAFIALALLEVVDEELDAAAVLSMALLHDLPEGITTDIPSPAWRYLPPGIKTEAERQAMHTILADAPGLDDLQVYWERLQADETAEARLVHDCDKLDMYIQAYIYERQTGNRQLAEFWKHQPQFTFTAARSIYDRLVSLRDQE